MSARCGPSSGTPLAQATFVNETASGWQQVLFATPVPVTANTVYVASYHAPERWLFGQRPASSRLAGVDNGVLHALSTAQAGGNGVYAYSPDSAFPSSSLQATNYWVDVVFDTTAGWHRRYHRAGRDHFHARSRPPTFSTSTTPLSPRRHGLRQRRRHAGVVVERPRRLRAPRSAPTTWTATGIALQAGVNVITVTARDAANNASTDTLTVTYTGSGGHDAASREFAYACVGRHECRARHDRQRRVQRGHERRDDQHQHDRTAQRVEHPDPGVGELQRDHERRDADADCGARDQYRLHGDGARRHDRSARQGRRAECAGRQ